MENTKINILVLDQHLVSTRKNLYKKIIFEKIYFLKTMNNFLQYILEKKIDIVVVNIENDLGLYAKIQEFLNINLFTTRHIPFIFLTKQKEFLLEEKLNRYYIFSDLNENISQEKYEQIIAIGLKNKINLIKEFLNQKKYISLHYDEIQNNYYKMLSYYFIDTIHIEIKNVLNLASTKIARNIIQVNKGTINESLILKTSNEILKNFSTVSSIINNFNNIRSKQNEIDLITYLDSICDFFSNLILPNYIEIKKEYSLIKNIVLNKYLGLGLTYLFVYIFRDESILNIEQIKIDLVLLKNRKIIQIDIYHDDINFIDLENTHLLLFQNLFDKNNIKFSIQNNINTKSLHNTIKIYF